MTMKDSLGRTTLVVDTSTRDKLKQFGSKGETYEDIIKKLMDYYEKSNYGPGSQVSG
jgi:hypothetical protein